MPKKRERIETPQWIVKKKSVTRSKYNVEKELAKRTYKGVVYDSAMEMRYFIEVVEPLMQTGYITEYKRQVPYVLMPGFKRNGKLVRAIEYIADFVITYSNGIQEIIDVKGMPDNVAKLKRKLFWNIYPDMEYRWVTYNKAHGGWVDYDELQVQKREEKKQKEKEEKEKRDGNQ